MQEWLERVRLATGAQSAREGERVQRLWAGYGEIRRVHLSGADRPSVIVKRVHPPPAPSVESEKRSHARKLRSYEVEATWYERYASRCDASCRVARLVLCERSHEEPLLVLEDLDAAGYGARRPTLSRANVLVCLEWVAQFHATFASDPGEGLWVLGTYWHLETRPDELAACRDPALRAAAHRLAARLRSARYRTLVHGDAKPANFCFARDRSAVAAVDFQYVGPGIGVQDVAYCIDAYLDAGARVDEADALLDHYFASLRRALSSRKPELDAVALEAEWRALYPSAWADFYRFLSGWAPGQYEPNAYVRRMLELALSERDGPRHER